MAITRDELQSGDNLPQGLIKLNSNSSKDLNLQQIVGIQDEDSQLGGYADPGSDASLATDTIKVRINRHERRIEAFELTGGDANVRHSGDGVQRDRDLGGDYDYRTVIEGVIGTTNITTGGAATTLGYPAGAGIYHIEVTISKAPAGSGANDNDLRTALISNGSQSWMTSTANGSDWSAIRSLGGSSTGEVVVADTGWGSPSGGEYTKTLTAATDHLQGSEISVSLMEDLGASLAPWYGDYEIDDVSGDIVIKCSEVPDGRINLRAIVRAN